MRACFSCLTLVLLAVGLPTTVMSQFTNRINTQLRAVTDTDPSDGFNFVEEFSEDLSVRVVLPSTASETRIPLISNEQVDGGSRTTFSGISLRELSFSMGAIDIVKNEIPGEIVLWDRADFDELIIELNFEIGDSTVNMVYLVDANNSKQVDNFSFIPLSPMPNQAFLSDLRYSSAAEAELRFTDASIRIVATADQFGGAGTYTAGMISQAQEILIGDVNRDDSVDLLDVAPFVQLLLVGGYSPEADINL